METQVYWEVSGAQHAANIRKLRSQGYGMISLSVYGDPGSARYAAVWVNRLMPAWVEIHDASATDYQNWLNAQIAQGYVLQLVSVTGPASSAVFAAVMVQGVTAGWMARHGLSAADFDAQNTVARSAGMIPISVSIYGDPGSPAYAAIWRANPGLTKWLVNPADPASSIQATLDTDTQLPGVTLNGWRPAAMAMSSDQTYCSVFTDDYVGPFLPFLGISAAGLKGAVGSQRGFGRYPILLQGSGSGSTFTYTAVFAAQDQPMARQWTVTGMTMPPFPSIDGAMEAFMKANSVRAAQAAFGIEGSIQFNKGYTWAEPGYRVTQPSDRFLLASCSKMFCEAVIQALFDAGTLSAGDLAYARLGLSGPLDPLSDTITIQDLLDHEGGYDDTISGSNFDPTYRMGDITTYMGVSPLTRLDVCKYMYHYQRLQYTPGKGSVYSNYGYLLLAAIADAVTPQRDYYSYLQAALLQPENITEVGIISTLASGRTDQEAIAEDPGLGPNVLDPASPRLVPSVYGGDGEINEIGVGNAGLGASARAMAQFAHLHATWGNGGRTPGLTRMGTTPGARTWVWSRTNDVDAALTINTSVWPAVSASVELQATVDSLLHNGKVIAVMAPGTINVIELFYRGRDHGIWTLQSNPDDGTWSGKTEVGGQLIGDPVAVTVPGTTILQLLYRGFDNALRTISRNPDGTWTAEVSLGGQLMGDPVAAVVPGTTILQLLYRSWDNAIWTRSRNPDGTWTAPASLGGQLTTNPVAAPVPGTGILQVFYRGTDSALWTLSRNPDGTWTAPASLGEQLNGDPVPFSTPGTDDLELFYRSFKNDICTRSRNPDGTWTPQSSLSGQINGNPVAVVAPFSTTLQLFYWGVGNAIYTRWRQPDGNWSAEANLGGNAVYDPSVVTMRATPLLEFFYRGADDGVWTRWRQPDGTWPPEKELAQ